jgi:hypothetical protein
MQFVIAALVAAVFLIDLPRDQQELSRRFFQVALAFCVVAFVLGLAVYAFPFKGFPFSAVQPGVGGGEAISKALRGRHILEAVAAVGLTLAGLASWPVARTLSIAGLLAGTLLFAISVSPDSQNSVGVLYDFTSQAGGERNLLLAVVLGGGALSLALYGFNQWDRQDGGSDDYEDTEAAEPDRPQWQREQS